MTKPLYGLPPGADFAGEITRFVTARITGIAMADVIIWVPSPRIAALLRDTFTTQLGGAAILPDIRPLSISSDMLEVQQFDHDFATNCVTPLERLMILTQLILARSPLLSYAAALAQAQHLDDLFNKFVNYNIDTTAITTALPPELATHWQKNRDFLEVILKVYPNYLSDIGREDVIIARRQALPRIAEKCAHAPLIIAAGFNDTTPSGLTILKAVQQHPHGQIFLSGYSSVVPTSEDHDQYALHQLAVKLNSNIEQYGIMNKPTVPICTVADDVEHEAHIITLMMREAIESPSKTCALVTGDRSLALRVSTLLNKFNLEVDDSAGRPLLQYPIGQLVRLLLQLCLRDAPENVAAFYQHPWVHHPDFLTVDHLLLRGPAAGRLRDTLALRQLRPEQHQLCHDFITDVTALTQALDAPGEAAVQAWAARLLEVIVPLMPEGLSAAEDTFMTLMNQWRQAGSHVLSFAGFASSLTQLMKTTVVRQPHSGHPRLFIWGAMEARLQPIDRVIIAGVNEGGWPRKSTPDPWLSLSMAQVLGLPSNDHFTGLTAHDFMMLNHQPEVMMTRSLRQGGAETVPSRFLWLRTDREDIERRGDIWADRARKMMTKTPHTVRPPAVKVAEKPTTWSPSFISKLLSCPYQAFVQKILAAEEMPGYSEDLTAADKGNMIHLCLEAVMVDLPDLPGPYRGDWQHTKDVTALLLDIGASVFSRIGQPGRKAIWWQKYQQIASGFAREMAQLTRSVWQVEASGDYILPNGITIKARADRIDLQADGSAVVMDYKTGIIPSKNKVLSGEAPQLPLEALLVEVGGYGEKRPVAGMEYWEVKGEASADVVVKPVKLLAQEEAAAALSGVQAISDQVMADTFQFEATPPSRYSRKGPCKTCPYSGLCRFEQWQTGKGDVHGS